MTEPARRLHTYDDLLALGEGARAELLGAEIVVSPSPSPTHQGALALTYAELLGPFQRGRGGPGGWWLIPDVDVAFGPHDVVRPDVSGWRRENVPTFPTMRPVAARPDWLCEALSPGSAVFDQGPKKALYARAGVPWYWLLDPLNRTVTVLELVSGVYQTSALVGDRGRARLSPFEDVELDLDALFPPPAE